MKRLSIIFLFLLWHIASIFAEDIIGKTEGSCNVSSSGAAIYQIPIELPTDDYGYSPDIQIVYNSQSPNGLLGYGWGLQGSSAISRSVKTIYHDGTAEAINFGITGPYNLDGKRLVSYQDNIHPSEILYSPEDDPTTRVTPYGEGFRVYKKDGTILDYGTTADSRIGEIGKPWMWLLKQSIDNRGRIITYTYGGFPLQNRFFLRQIDFDNDKSVRFNYFLRTDANKYWFAGQYVLQDQLLESISVYVKDTKVKEYVFSSHFDGYYTKLTKVQQFGQNGESYAPTEFSYKGSSAEYKQYAPVKSKKSLGWIRYGDFDGDGKTDFLSYSSSQKTVSIYKANSNWGELSFSLIGTLSTDNSFLEVYVADIDGNGLQNIVIVNDNGLDYQHTYYAVKNNQINKKGIFHLPRGGFLCGNYTGSGKSEFLSFAANELYDNTGTFIANANNINWNNAYNHRNQLYIPSTKYIRDINGDGKEDILIIKTDGLRAYEYQEGTIRELPSFRTANITSNDVVSCGDFNGDGYTDIVTRQHSSCCIYFSTGQRFSKASYTLNTLPDYPVMVGDFNGDGRSDLFHLDHSTGDYRFAIEVFNGRGFTTSYTSAPVHPGQNGGTELFDEYSTLADFDGDGRTEYGCFYYDDKVIIKHFADNENLLLSRVTDGLGLTTQFTYSSGTSSTCVNTYDEVEYPTAVLSTPLKLVASVTRGSDYGVNNRQTYFYYKNPLVHVNGKGFLCFEETTSISELDKTTSRYSLYLPYYYPYLSSQIRTGYGERVLNSDYYSLGVRQLSDSRPFRYVPYVSIANHTDSLTGHSRQTFSSIDDFGNITISNTFSNDGHEESVQISYANDCSTSWTIGLPTELIKTQSYQNSTWSQKQSFTYNQKHLLSTQTEYLGDLNIPVSKIEYIYNDQGNVVKQKQWLGSQAIPLEETYEYSSDGCRMTKSVDTFSQEQSFYYDAIHRLSGIKKSSGLRTDYGYDGMGRLVKEDRNDGQSFSISFHRDNNYSETVWRKDIEKNDGNRVNIWYDAFGQVVQESSNNFQDNELFTEKRYDYLGRLLSKSQPHKNDGSWSTDFYEYDRFGRISKIKHATGDVESYAYDGNRITHIGNGVETQAQYDSQGNILKVTDSNGDIVNTLRPDGQPLTTNALGITTEFGYDNHGRQVSITDPSGGLRSYSYNSIGLIETISDADGRTVRFTYDEKGRKIAEQRKELTTTYTYNDRNLLQSQISTNGTGVVFTYDSIGRVVSRRDLLPDNRFLHREYNYYQGHLREVRYSNEIGNLGTECRTYSHGNLCNIIFQGIQVWRLVEDNSLGQYVKSSSENVTWTSTFSPTGDLKGKSIAKGDYIYQNQLVEFDPATRNLIWRKDATRNLTEHFGYDKTNRLTSYGNHQIDYDYLGNITQKTDAGLHLLYRDPESPYRMTGLSSSFEPDLVNYSNQRIVYNSFECPDTLEDGGIRTTFLYNAVGERVMMKVHRSDFPTRYYVDNIYEEECIGNNSVFRLYLGGDAYSAPAVYIGNRKGGNIFYLGRDYLGSITHVTDNHGNLIQEYSYDAWGRLRNPQTQELYPVGQEPSLFLGRGYCGHEHLPWCGLINMNARLYDPVLGRFLSPDPYIQMPGNSQNFNRYSYCLNNPLKYVDKNGEIIQFIIAGAVVGGLINLGIKAFNGQIHNFGDAFSAFGIGALSGGLGGAAGGWAFAAAGGAVGVAGAGGFLAGAASGAAGAAIGSPVLSYGNHIAFGDPLMSLKEYLGAVAFSGITGGIANGILAKMNGRNFWNGNLPESPSWGYFSSETVTSQIDNTGSTISKAEVSQMAPDDIVERTLQSPDFPQGSGTNSVYIGQDSEGIYRYVGITERQPELRFVEHLRSQTPRADLLYSPINSVSGLSRVQARIIEQNLINTYGLGKHGGQLFNKINSISSRYWGKWGIIINF